MKSSQIYIVAGTSILTAAALPQPAFGQIADSWAIAGDVTVEATNTGAAVSLTPETGTLISDATIADGSRNSISVSAVGASAAVAHNTASFQDLTIGDTVDGNVTVTASNNDSPVIVTGTIDGAQIDQGHDNAISVSAVGASAQIGIFDGVLDGAAVSLSLTFSGDITLSAENTGMVTVQTDVGTNGDGPQINGGTRNAFSVSAVGASAGVSVLTIVEDGTYASDIAMADGGAITVSAINSGDVTLGSTDDPAQPAMLSGAALGADSTDGSISMMAIGASASVSSTTVVYSGSAEPNVTFGDVSFDVENSGAVTANVSITDLTLEGRNSISVGAMGTSISNSTRLIDYTGDSLPSGGTIGAVAFSATNAGALYVMGGMSNAVIGSGIGLSIATNAIGASAAFTLP